MRNSPATCWPRFRIAPFPSRFFPTNSPGWETQALKIASWGSNLYVKIPVTNTKRATALPLIRKLAGQGVKLNITAIMTLAQVRDVVSHLNPEVPSYVSVFAGRIADTGIDPLPLMSAAVVLTATNPAAEVIWASPARALEHISGRRNRMSHYHRDKRRAEEDRPYRTQSRRLLTRYREYVLQGCDRRRLQDLGARPSDGWRLQAPSSVQAGCQRLCDELRDYSKSPSRPALRHRSCHARANTKKCANKEMTATRSTV